MADPKGHQASSPSEIPAPGWKDIAARSLKRALADNVGLVAAGVLERREEPDEYFLWSRR